MKGAERYHITKYPLPGYKLEDNYDAAGPMHVVCLAETRVLVILLCVYVGTRTIYTLLVFFVSVIF